jgi:Domain of unknown function (DUF4338)
MTHESEHQWTELLPPLHSEALDRFGQYARELLRVRKGPVDWGLVVEDKRRIFVRASAAADPCDRQTLLAAGHVLTDLVLQGWLLRLRRGSVEVRQPTEESEDRAAEKERIRRQELIKRNAQLQGESVQRFLRAMERPRFFDQKAVSIFCLMREGRELAEKLRGAREKVETDGAEVLAAIVVPYLQFVSSEHEICRFTGFRLMDIWRYFRHTWTNQYQSVPGRMMMFIVRDRAAPFHPVVGIGALSSPVVQIRERDSWIGWNPEVFIARLRAEPTIALANWLVAVVDTAIEEIYCDDFFEDGILTQQDLKKPDTAAIGRLLDDSLQRRQLHHRCARARDHKARRGDLTGGRHWVERARTHLFRSKRALALASYLRARTLLRGALGARPTPERLAKFASTGQGKDVIRRLLKKAKADKIGIAVADITVCGAIQPYNAILGGKLVAMLAASPEVVLEYRRRYSDAESEIASSVAGRPIVRKPTLVLLTTTSLYAIGSSQYNRIKVPCDRLGGSEHEAIRFAELGHSEAYGTSQYSEETIDALTDLVQQSANGRRVNSIFGEGVSPKLRKVRQGLELLNFRSTTLLRHHRRRVVYAVSLVRNLCEYLLGFEKNPAYLVPLNDGAWATAQIGAWWRERWLRSRIVSDSNLDEVARHTLVRPIRHGARVVSPPNSQRSLFPDGS